MISLGVWEWCDVRAGRRDVTAAVPSHTSLESIGCHRALLMKSWLGFVCGWDSEWFDRQTSRLNPVRFSPSHTALKILQSLFALSALGAPGRMLCHIGWHLPTYFQHAGHSFHVSVC